MDRRSFLGSLLGLAATPLVAPPEPLFKKFFSLFIPKKAYPDFSLRELQLAIDRATYGASKPSIILLSEDQYKWLESKMLSINQLYLATDIATAGYSHLHFNGIPTMSKNTERPLGFWPGHAERYNLLGRVSRPLDVTSSLGRPS